VAVGEFAGACVGRVEDCGHDGGPAILSDARALAE
jgi:hypothetical protein